MDSTWSVDAIYRGQAEDIVRLAKYQPPSLRPYARHLQWTEE